MQGRDRECAAPFPLDTDAGREPHLRAGAGLHGRKHLEPVAGYGPHSPPTQGLGVTLALMIRRVRGYA